MTTPPIPAPTLTSRHDRASSVAAELLRTALLAKLAVDLADPPLARRAARYAQSSARLLAGLDFPAHVDQPDDHDDDQALPKVEDALQLVTAPHRPEESSGNVNANGGAIAKKNACPNKHRECDADRPASDALPILGARRAASGRCSR